MKRFLFLLWLIPVAQAVLSQVSSIPPERLAPGGWHETVWQDPGGWQTIDVTTRGILPNGADMTGGLKTLINSLTQPTILYFPAGTYVINDLHIDYQNDDIIFRGAGADQTTVDVTTGASAFILFGTPVSYERSITAAVPEGGTDVTVNDASGLAVGDIVTIVEDLVNAENWGIRGRGGVFKITAVNGNILTIDTPLAIGLDNVTAKSARLGKFDPLQNIGIENMHFSHPSTVEGVTIDMRWADNIYIRNISSFNCSGNHIQVKESRNIIVRDSYLSGSQRVGGGQGYGLIAQMRATNICMTNNILRNLHVSYGTQIGASYNIFSYNYYVNEVYDFCLNGTPAQCDSRQFITDGTQNGFFDARESGDVAIHGHYPHNTLYEGNVLYNFGIDYYWHDNGPHHTMFRNYLRGTPEADGFWEPHQAVTIDGPDDGQNIIGNTVQNDAFIAVGTWDPKSTRSAQNLFIGKNDVVGVANFSNQGGTYYVGPTYQWDNLTSDATIPDSLYLATKPDFWPSNLAWPPFGPDVSGSRTNKIPAQLRYESMQNQTPVCVAITNSQLLQAIYSYRLGSMTTPETLNTIRIWKAGC